jgi:hypothetical protein
MHGLFAFTIVLNVLATAVGESDNVLLVVISLSTILCLWIYLFYLGKLVGIYNKSKILWIGGSLVTAPIGPIVAYNMMADFVEEDLKLEKRISTDALAEEINKKSGGVI